MIAHSCLSCDRIFLLVILCHVLSSCYYAYYGRMASKLLLEERVTVGANHVTSDMLSSLSYLFKI